MKKSIILIIVLVAVLISFGVWLMSAQTSPDLGDLVLYPIVLIILVFAVIVIWSRIKSHMKGEPAEDELSKSILRKASSMAFYTSLYAWLVISYLNDNLGLETHTVIGGGIIVMVIIFIAYWGYYGLRGVKDV